MQSQLFLMFIVIAKALSRKKKAGVEDKTGEEGWKEGCELKLDELLS
jgi:hypothetical protein